MTDQLLPPDPSKDGWYWVDVFGVQVAAVWVPSTQWWMQLRDGEHMTAGTAWRAGYRLASPHPIPGPEQLNALHALPDSLERQAETDIMDAGLSQDHFTHWRQSAGYSAARLRAALGAKP